MAPKVLGEFRTDETLDDMRTAPTAPRCIQVAGLSKLIDAASCIEMANSGEAFEENITIVWKGMILGLDGTSIWHAPQAVDEMHQIALF